MARLANNFRGSRISDKNSWESFMSTVLLNADIPSELGDKLAGEERTPCPDAVMKERQKMVRSQALTRRTEMFPHPSELKMVEAKKLIREENLERLIREKEERILKRAIVQLEQSFFHRRKTVHFDLLELEKSRGVKNRTKRVQTNGRRMDLGLKIPKLNVPCGLPQMVPNEEKITDVSLVCQKAERIPAVVGVRRKTRGKRQCSPPTESKEANGDDPSPKMCNSPNSPQQSNKGESVEVAAPEVVPVTPVKEGSDTWNLEYCWETWRKFVAAAARKNREKVNRQSKIDSFVKRLSEKPSRDGSASDAGKRKQRFEFKSRKGSRSKTPELQQIDKDIEKSSQGFCRSLEKGLKSFHPRLRPKAKAMITLAGGRKKKDGGESNPGRRRYPVPDVLLRMEARHKERRERWENIEKRKKRMQEEKEEIEREREEERRRAEEMKKKQDAEMMRERRRRKKEAEERRKSEKLRLKQSMQLAEEHYLRYVVAKVGFRPWRNLVETRRRQWQDAIRRSECSARESCWVVWRKYVHTESALRYERADEFRRKALLKRSFHIWVIERRETVKRLQVADDWADAKHAEHAFRKWLTNHRQHRRETVRKEELADSEFERKLKRRCLTRWMRLPELAKREREKEMRKQTWRRKVQEFLPDYQPSVVCDTT